MDNTKMVLRSRLNLGFNLNYLRLHLNVMHLKLFFFTEHIFNFFYPKINKINITITSLTFQVSKMDLTTFLV